MHHQIDIVLTIRKSTTKMINAFPTNLPVLNFLKILENEVF